MQIKICGLTRREDAQTALRLGVTAVGCVFYPQSSRSVTVEEAKKLSTGITGLATFVALFVNPNEKEVGSVLEQLPVHMLQFHGLETAEFCRQFGRPYIKAVPMNAHTDLRQWDRDYRDAAALLLDTASGSQFGGSGRSFDWSLIPKELAKRVILAGGLNVDNVASAVRQVRPLGVDVSTGVECSPGVKDASKMKSFIVSARRAYEDEES